MIFQVEKKKGRGKKRKRKKKGRGKKRGSEIEKTEARRLMERNSAPKNNYPRK